MKGSKVKLFSDGTISHLKSHLKSCIERSKAKAEFVRLSAENVDMSDDDIIDELRKMTTTVNGSKVKLFTDGTISWVKSTLPEHYLERSMAQAEFDRLSAENVDRSVDDIIDELSEMTVKGSKVKLFSDGTIRLLKSHQNQHCSKVKYEELIASGDMSPDDAIAVMKASGKFDDSTINWLRSATEYARVQATYNDLEKCHSDWDCDRIIAEIKASGKFSAGAINWLMGMKNETNDRSASAAKGCENSIASRAVARAAVADGSIKNASNKTQVIAKNLDDGHKKKGITKRLKADIKTLEKGGDMVELQCNLCEDKRPYDSSNSSQKQVGKKFQFFGTKSKNGLSCPCSAQHKDWDVSRSMTGPEVASALEDAKAQLVKNDANKNADELKRKKAIKKAEEEDAKAAKSGADTKQKATKSDDTSKPPVAQKKAAPAKKATSNSSQKATEPKKKSSNTKSSVDNNKSTSSKATVGKRKSSEDKGKRKRSKADNVSSNEEEEKKTNPASKGGKKAAPAKKLDTSKGGKETAPAKKKGPKKKGPKKKGPKKKAINTKSSVTSSRTSNKSNSASSKPKGKRKSTSLCLAPAQHSSSLVAPATVIDVSTDERCVALRTSYWEGNLQEDMNFIIAEYEELTYLEIIKVFEAASNYDEASLSCQRRARKNRRKGELPGPR